MADPLISVIIPTYNTAKYLPQALDSLLMQQGVQLEIFVVDDGSTDETAAIIQNRYSDKVTYFYHANQGHVAARNTAMPHVQGDFLYFLDADDYLIDDHALSQLAAPLLCDPHLTATICGWQLVDFNGHPYKAMQPWADIPDFTPEKFFKHVPVRLNATLIRANADTLTHFDETLAHCEDVDYLFRLVLAGHKMAFLPKIMAAYRRHPDSITIADPVKISKNLLIVWRKYLPNPNFPGGDEGRHERWFFNWLYHAYRFADASAMTDLCNTLSELAAKPRYYTNWQAPIYWLTQIGQYFVEDERTPTPEAIDNLSAAFGQVLGWPNPYPLLPGQSIARRDLIEIWLTTGRDYYRWHFGLAPPPASPASSPIQEAALWLTFPGLFHGQTGTANDFLNHHLTDLPPQQQRIRRTALWARAMAEHRQHTDFPPLQLRDTPRAIWYWLGYRWQQNFGST